MSSVKNIFVSGLDGTTFLVFGSSLVEVKQQICEHEHILESDLVLSGNLNLENNGTIFASRRLYGGRQCQFMDGYGNTCSREGTHGHWCVMHAKHAF